MERFIINENIVKFRKLLAVTSASPERAVVSLLLQGEKLHLERLDHYEAEERRRKLP